MKLRSIALLAVVAMVACGGAAPEEEIEVVEEVPMDDAAAVEAMVDEFAMHFNLGHPAMAADYYTEDAISLLANGSVYMDAEGRLTSLETQVAMNAQLAVDTADVLVVGDSAVGRGSYSIDATPEGADPIAVTGNWMASFAKIDGDWKFTVALTNYDSDPPENLPDPVIPAEPPPDAEDSLIDELMGYYATHFNMGHGGMVASRYTEDAVAALAGQPQLEGRASIEENLNARIEEMGNPQLTIHVVGANEVGDGFVFGGGWYELASDAGNSQGSFVVLARPGDDGNLQIQWAASNGLPVYE